MKEHFCPIEKEWIGYEGQCNWCGEKELVKKKAWIGLEDEDVATVKNEFNRGALWAEAVLKEKNS